MLQSEGLEAAGCAGSGVGYAAASREAAGATVTDGNTNGGTGDSAGAGRGCTRGIRRSLAVHFDTHYHTRTVERRSCIDENVGTGACEPGALRVDHSLECAAAMTLILTRT